MGIFILLLVWLGLGAYIICFVLSALLLRTAKIKSRRQTGQNGLVKDPKNL